MESDLLGRLRSALADNYEIVRELGGGGMSRVFVAEEVALGRRVVIKVLPPEAAAAVSAERFRREVQLAAQLRHPLIVPLHAAGETADGLLYYTMPYVEGESLRARLAREGALPLADAVRVLREVADALAYAHGRGVVHRDIKPENILLEGSHALVTDFGVAKALSASTSDGGGEPGPGSATGTGISIGTPAYMAPEQVAGDPGVDARADLYSLGLVAYEMLAGAHPFAGRAPQAALVAQLTEAPAPLAERRPDAPPALAALVMRLLEKRPEERPQSAAEVLRLLEEHATPAATASAAAAAALLRPGPARGRAWWRRRPALAALAVAALAAAGALVAVRRDAPAAAARAAAAADGQPVLAVLPFENLGPPGDEYFADGLTDEITSRLAGVSGLRVIGRASARRYKGTTEDPREIARELGATHLLTGTVRWDRVAGGTSTAAGRVRVSPELVRGADGSSVWAEPYEAPLSDIFRVQGSVAERVAGALDVALLARERRAVTARPTTNLAAYDAYLRGLANSGRTARYSIPLLRAAAAEFERAVALDPGFAAAHARLADVYVPMYELWTGDTAALARARASAARAWALDSMLLESRLARARYLIAADDPEGAYRVLSAAAAEAPDNAELLFRLAEAEEARGQLERGIAVARRAMELDPRSADAPAQLAGLYHKTHRYAESIPIREREIALVPENAPAYFMQATAYLQSRWDTAGARRIVERGGRALEALYIRMPSGSAGRAIWPHLLPPSVLRAKDTLTLAGYVSGGELFAPDLFHLAKLQHFAHGGQTARARAHADSLVRQMEEALRRAGNARFILSWYSRRGALAEAYAYIGRSADAAREVDLSVAEARRVRNAAVLPGALVEAAYVDAAIGRRDLAVARLAEAFRLPSGQLISPAVLRADSAWAPLRGHPGFERLSAGASAPAGAAR